MASLSGRWKLSNEGSDYYPGLDSLPDSPLILKLLGTTEVEFYRIEKRKTLEIEELQFTYVTKGISMSRSYQIGVLNYETINGNNVVLGIIQNCDELFYEFSLIRLGPKAGQSSREVYKFNPGTNQVTLQVELTTPDGTHLKMIKYLLRFDEKEKIEQITFKHAVNSLGWKLFEFWDSTILSNAQTKIIRAVKIKSQSLQTNTETKVLDTLWNDPDFDRLFQNNEFDWSSIAKSYGTKNSEAEEVVEFIVKVTIGESHWFVAHRYREFDALRKFILQQNPFNTEFQQADGRFPGKMMSVAFPKKSMDKRVEGLESFLGFYLENARFCRQNSIDALCSFLQIPENMHRIARLKAAAEPPQPPPVTAATKASTKSTATAASVTSTTKTTDTTKSEKPSTFMKMLGGGGNSSAPTPQKKEPTPTPTGTVSSVATTTSNAAAVTTTASNATEIPPPANGQKNIKAVGSHTTTDTAQSSAPPFLTPQLSPAQKRLASRLNDGIQVIKHGRQGNPHPRTLQCDDEVQNLIIQAPDHYKKIALSEIDGIRLGSEIDPITSAEAIARYNNESQEQRQTRRRSTIGFFLGKDDILFGTAILRRTCKQEEMHLCISLLMENRTLDLQCANQEDVNFLYKNLKEIIDSAPR